MASASGDEAVELLVARVQPLRVPRAEVEVDVGNSFAVLFHGPMRPVLPSACVELRPVEGDPMIVFLTLIGVTRGVMEYEAIFNRMEPPPQN